MDPDQKLLHAIGAAKNAQALLVAMREYYRAAERVGEEVEGSSPVKLACRENCAFCCYIPVGARAQEVFLLADFIRSNFSPELQAAVIEKLRKHFAVVSSMSRETQATTNIPCPLLEGSRCSAYSARPLACRGYHSLDVSSCEYSFEYPDDTVASRPQLADLASAWMRMSALANGAFAEHG